MLLPIIGWADDLTVFGSDEAYVEPVQDVLAMFETGAMINREKTCMMGHGHWVSKSTWDGAWDRVFECITTRGVTWCQSYELTVRRNWEGMLRGVGVATSLMSTRQLT